MKMKLVAAACVAGAVLLAANAGIATAAPPSFQFGITVGEPPPPPPPPHHGPHFPPPDYTDDCMSVRAIVSDLAASYRGSLALDASEHGGLKAILELPAA